MKLLVDIGNTRMKAAVSDGGRITRVDEKWKEYAKKAERIVVSNVSGSRFQVPDSYGFQEVAWDMPEVRLWLKDVPEGMGADRVANDIGARRQCVDRPVLVVDAGTCLTFDLLDSEGRIVGGAISPGAATRLKSMHDYTAALPLFEPVHEKLNFIGTDTRSAMLAGAQCGMWFEIEGYIRATLRLYPTLRVFVTGGGGRDVPEDLRGIVTVDPLLTFKGLDAV